MHVFNQGKYRSLHAQKPNELTEIRELVEQDQDFYPRYHLAPPTGLLNDPNGLVFDGEQYHIFYQWYPYDALHGMKHWKHFITRDFQHFSEADPLIPDELFESHGCYSGGAILWQDKIVAFYTGNTRRASDNQRVPHQNIAIFDKAGKLLSKRCIINQAPQGYTEHVRDPKPFITQEGKIRFVLGAQRQDLSGTALLYEMDSLESEPKLLGELSVNGFSNQQVFMWECPDLFKLGDKDLFIWSPQGKERESHQFQNNYHAVYAVGQLADRNLQAEQIAELDYGFDFYAPQTIENSDRILFGWVGLPDLTYPTDSFKWHSALSLPRHIELKQGKLYQKPLAKLSKIRPLNLEGRMQIEGLDQAYLQIKPENRPLTLKFFSNEQNQHLTLSYANGLVSLDRTASEQTELMRQFGQQHHCEIAHLESIEIYFDRSIIEIFLNGGEKTMTSRFFIAKRENVLESSRPVQAAIASVEAIKYK